MKTELWNDNKIRFVQINGEWWAVGKDVTDALSIRNNRDAIRKLDDDEKGVATIDTLGGKQEVAIIAETGIYELIFKSRKEEAKSFKKWIKSVIKELRQSTGLEGFEIFRMLDKEHQKAAMQNLKKSLQKPVRVDFIKANTIANKAVSNLHGFPKMFKKSEMTPDMLIERQEILDSTVELMGVKDKYGLQLSVSREIYANVSYNNKKLG